MNCGRYSSAISNFFLPPSIKRHTDNGTRHLKCVLGRACSLELVGVGFASTNRVLVAEDVAPGAPFGLSVRCAAAKLCQIDVRSGR